MSKRVILLGSSGSIGTQSLDVIRRQNDTVAALAVHRNTDLLLRQTEEFHPQAVCVADEQACEAFAPVLRNAAPEVQLFCGSSGLVDMVNRIDADVVLNAVVGIAGLPATLAAAKKGVTVALANKESLVTGGRLVTETVAANHARLLPVDSEHSAIFQCLQDANSARTLEKIYLTASGGPFYGKTEAELAYVTAADALKHPNWSMGAKITIDSASLMNKGLELIEAVWLFGLPAEKIQIVVQRESIIHSMVQFSDHSVLAQLGVPDMRIPIQYALTWPQRGGAAAPEVDFASLRQLSFGTADEKTFRCLAACKTAIGKGGLAPCAANGANEEAVAMFLQGRISFLDIGRLVSEVAQGTYSDSAYTLPEVLECDRQAREYVRQHYRR